MAYTPQQWVDESKSTPLSATRMNHIESGLKDVADVADQVASDLAPPDASGAVGIPRAVVVASGDPIPEGLPDYTLVIEV